MAKLPVVKQLQTQDFASQTSWISPLIYSINLVFGAVYAALNKGITINDNCLAQINSVSITTAASAYYAAGPTKYATAGPGSVISWTWNYSSRPVGVSLIQITDTSSTPVPVLNAVTVDFSYSGGTVIINAISGLNASKSYSATFITWGG
jgi:hypothetical protein